MATKLTIPGGAVQQQAPHEAASMFYELTKSGRYAFDEIVNLLKIGRPQTVEEYSEHINKIMVIMREAEPITHEQRSDLKTKLFALFDSLDKFVDGNNLINSKLYIIVEQNFDMLIRATVNSGDLDAGSQCIRFLTNVIMNLNYWEMYNLLSWKPAIHHFLTVIHYNLNECYQKFVKDYTAWVEKQRALAEEARAIPKRRGRKPKRFQDEDQESITSDSSGSLSPQHVSGTSQTSADDLHSQNLRSLMPKSVTGEKIIKFPEDSDMNPTHKVIKKSNSRSNKSSNYDPDVVHECQLPSADEPDKACLRRFSRKYELIRHQETVHSKKKRLFKCYVCVKQNPAIGPRIFTRHDTLAKHIRVNHKISGKEAKAEVAYSKKHAEIVEDGDITVHVGRRKTKVNFELRAHMEKRRLTKDGDIDDDMDLDNSSNGILVDEIDDEYDDDDEQYTAQSQAEHRSGSPQQMSAQEQYEQQFRRQLLAQHSQQRESQMPESLISSQLSPPSGQQSPTTVRPALESTLASAPAPVPASSSPPNMYHNQFPTAYPAQIPQQLQPPLAQSPTMITGMPNLQSPQAFVHGQSQFQISLGPTRAGDGKKVQVKKETNPMTLPPIISHMGEPYKSPRQ